MRSSRASTLVALLLGAGVPALAQQRAQGFAVERLSPSAPGGGWLVMDELDLRGGLGGAISLTTGYAHRPLVVSSADGTMSVPVVSDALFADIGGAVTFSRFRLSLNLTSPLYLAGKSGVVGGVEYAGAVVNLAADPDLLSDARVGFDALLFGEPGGSFRLGAGAQLLIPSGTRAHYVTDGTYRGVGRLMLAGESGRFTWAAQLGLHLRPLDEAAVPGNPRGSELLVGMAGGARWQLASGTYALIVGPELFGATALAAFLGSGTVGLEALLGARLESTSEAGPRLRVKLGVGAGLVPSFGAPDWRLVAAVELFGRQARPAQPSASSTFCAAVGGADDRRALGTLRRSP